MNFKASVGQSNHPHFIALAIGFLAVYMMPSNCFGFQSGSRSSAPAASGPPAVSQPSFSQPAFSQPSFSQPSFSQPLFSQPSFSPQPSFGSPTAQPAITQQFSDSVLAPQNSFGVEQDSFNQGSFGSQFNDGSSFNAPSVDSFQSMPMNQSMSSAQASPSQMSGSSSPGIPEAAVVDPIFEINNPNSMMVVDHSAWDAFLSKYVAPDSQCITRVAYRNVSCQDRQSLQCYLQRLQSTDIRNLNRNEQLAYWFNLYNARTVAVVLENYPIQSIRQVKQKLTDFVGPFDDEGAVNVLGKSLSLNDIESGVIRPIWNDPRIHYALNCASYGCPNLATTAWQSHNIDARLNDAAYKYINSGRAVKRSCYGLRASKIYKWYAGDFGGEEGVLKHLRQYANCNTLQTLNCHSSISGYFYDWSLNDAKIQRRRIFEPFIR